MIRRYTENGLVLSTAHIKPETAVLLDGPRDGHGLILYRKGDYGWFICTAAEACFDTAKLPAELVVLVEEAQRCGCDWLILDRDAEEVEGLPVFDWDNAEADPPKPDLAALLGEAESFISGFEGDAMQEGVDDLLKRIREAL